MNDSNKNREVKGVFLELDEKEEKVIEEIKEEADKEIKELLETIKLIKDVKNRGLYLLGKIKELDKVLKRTEKNFNKKEYIYDALDIIDRQLDKLKKEELVALQEAKEEDKLEKFILNLTKKADKIVLKAKKELEKEQ